MMIKTLQVISLICAIAGTAMALDLMFRLQPGRDVPTRAPCMDASGEPTC